jgi:FkbM family methyltransferase
MSRRLKPLVKCVVPKNIRSLIKRLLVDRARRKFYRKPDSAFTTKLTSGMGELYFDGNVLKIPQPFAGGHYHWLSTHVEDVIELETFLRVANQSEGLMFDVGAYKGFFSALFCKVSKHNAVAFEPVPKNQLAINQIAELNGLTARIDVRAIAIGNQISTMRMHFDETFEFAQIQKYSDSCANSPSTIVVQTSTVDAMRRLIGKTLGLLKIDVEGFEGEVLEGANKTLWTDRPVIVLEVHNDYLAERGVSLRRILHRVAAQEYVLMALNGRILNASAASSWILPRIHLLAVPCERKSRYQQLVSSHN